jgi:hypothetical protein
MDGQESVKNVETVETTEEVIAITETGTEGNEAKPEGTEVSTGEFADLQAGWETLLQTFVPDDQQPNTNVNNQGSKQESGNLPPNGKPEGAEVSPRDFVAQEIAGLRTNLTQIWEGHEPPKSEVAIVGVLEKALHSVVTSFESRLDEIESQYSEFAPMVQEQREAVAVRLDSEAEKASKMLTEQYPGIKVTGNDLLLLAMNRLDGYAQIRGVPVRKLNLNAESFVDMFQLVNSARLSSAVQKSKPTNAPQSPAGGSAESGRRDLSESELIDDAFNNPDKYRQQD